MGPYTEEAIAVMRQQVQATEDVAYALHTANLIAFERTQWEVWRRGELNSAGTELWHKAAEQVSERLGLG